MNKKMTRAIIIAAVLLLLCAACVGAASAGTFTVKVNSVATIEETGGNTYTDPAGGTSIVVDDIEDISQLKVLVNMYENGDIAISVTWDGGSSTLKFTKSNSGTDNKFGVKSGVVPSGGGERMTICKGTNDKKDYIAYSPGPGASLSGTTLNLEIETGSTNFGTITSVNLPDKDGLSAGSSTDLKFDINPVYMASDIGSSGLTSHISIPDGWVSNSLGFDSNGDLQVNVTVPADAEEGYYQWKTTELESIYSVGELTVGSPKAESYYKLIYDVNGGSGADAPKALHYLRSEPATVVGVPEGLTMTGCHSNGWNTKADGSGDNYAAGSSYPESGPATSGDHTLYVKWVSDGNTVTLTNPDHMTLSGQYSTDGGSTWTAFTSGETAIPENATVKVTAAEKASPNDYYRVKNTGWSTGTGGPTVTSTTDNEMTFTMGDAAVTVTATESQYGKVVYDANGGTGTAPVDANKYDVDGTTKTLTASGLIPPIGKVFDSWNTSAEGTGTSYAVGADYTVAKGVNTLYAKWTANKYTVTLDQKSGTGGAASVEATYGSDMPTATMPTRSGYTFGGYYDDEEGSGTQYYTADGTSAHTWDKTADTTLYAKWTLNKPTISGSGWTFDGTEHDLTCQTEATGVSYKWYKDDAELAGETSSTLSLRDVEKTGTYKVKITDSDSRESTSDGVSITISPLVATIGWSGDPFTYDGTSHVPTATVSNKKGEDVVSVSVTGGQTYPGTYSGDSAAKATGLTGEQSGNYTLTGATVLSHDFTINKVQLTVTGTTAYGKVYDGTTAAVTHLGTVGGIVGTEDVTVSCTGTFADPNASNGKPVTLTYSIAGSAIGNYLKPVDGATTADITRANQSDVSVTLADYVQGTTPGDPVISGLKETPTVTYTYRVKDTGEYTAWTSDIGKTLSAGAYDLKADYAATTNYNAGSSTTMFNVLSKHTVNAASVIGQGTVSYCLTESGTYASTLSDVLSETTVYIKAVPSSGWTTSASAITFGESSVTASSTANVYQSTMPDVDVTPAVTFTAKPVTTYTVSFATDGHGTVSPSSISGLKGGEGITVSGKTVYIAGHGSATAEPENGYAFAGWTCGGGDVPSTVTGSMTITANFEKLDGSVVISNTSVNFGTVTAGSTVPAEQSVTITNNYETSVSLVYNKNGGFNYFGTDVTSVKPGTSVTIRIQPESTFAGEYADSIAALHGSEKLNTVSITYSVLVKPEEKEEKIAVPEAPTVETREVVYEDKNYTEVKVGESANLEVIEESGKAIISEDGKDVVYEITGEVKQTGKKTVLVSEADEITACYTGDYKADLKQKDDIRVPYTSVIYTNTVNGPLPSLTGDFKEEVKKVVTSNGFETISMVSSLNEDPEAIDTNISSLAITFEIPKSEMKDKDKIKAYHVDGNNMQKVERDVTDDRESDCWDVTIKSDKGFSSYVVVYGDGTDPEPTPVYEKKSSSTVSFNGEKFGNDFTFNGAVVITKATLPGATSARITNNGVGTGWYKFTLSTDGFTGNGTLYFQVPLEDIAIKGYTVNDVSLFGHTTKYLSTEGKYAKYSASVEKDGTYTIGFKKDAAKTSSAATTITETKETTQDTQGYLKIVSTPAGAKIQFGSVEYIGYTPQEKIALIPGTYTVTLSLDGYNDISKTITVKAGETTPVTLSMQKKETTTTPTQTTTKSPVPVLGILAGLSAVAVLLRRQ